MGTFFEALRAGLKGGWEAATESSRPMHYTIGGHPLVCPQCKGETFMLGRNQLNTRGAEFFNLGWANATASTTICAECSNIQWFAQEPEVRSS
jgi:hypothetical protein